MAKGFFERTGNVKKLKEILDNLPEGTVITKKELSRLSGATTKTITNVLARDYPNPKFIIPDAATAQAMTVKKNVEKRMQNVETPSPITTNRTVSGVRWPNDTVKNSYIEDLKKKYNFTKGTTPEFSNKALALKYFGKAGAGEIAKIERMNNFLVKDLNLKFAPGSPRETYLRRKSRIDESKKFLTDREKTILNKQQSQKKLVNSFFKNNPNAINDPKYQKVKDLMNARFKDGKISFDVRPEKYYVNKAKGGKLFDLFDISAVASEKRNIRFPSNLNITPGQFNQAFIKQLTTYFDKNPNDIQALNEVESFLKSNGIRVEVPALGKRIGETAISSIDSSTGRLPNIENTFKKIGIDNLITKDYIPPKKILEVVKSQYNSEPAGSVFRKGMDNLVKCADGCFVKVANKNPERIAKKLSEEPQKLIEIFRGERANAPGTMAKYIPGTSEVEQVPYSDKLKGRFYTADKNLAKQFADDPSKIKSLTIPEKDFNIGTKIARRVNIDSMADQLILPRKILNQLDAGTLKYNSDIGAIVNTATDDVASQAELKTWADDNPMPVKAGTTNPGILRKTGRALAHLGLPLPTAALDTYFIGKQIQEGRDPTEIAKDPFNWLGLATMSPLTKAAGYADKSGKLASVMRLGMSPGMIRGATRFLGLPGLIISGGLTAYDQYKKYQDKEGFVYDLFNKEEIDNTPV